MIYDACNIQTTLMCIVLGRVDLVSVLIDSGADVNVRCADSGLTALMLAASQVLTSSYVLLS